VLYLGRTLFEHELIACVQMATIYLYTSINYLLLKVDSKSLVNRILDGDKNTDVCGGSACGDGVCRDDVCEDDVDLNNGENERRQN